MIGGSSLGTTYTSLGSNLGQPTEPLAELEDIVLTTVGEDPDVKIGQKIEVAVEEEKAAMCWICLALAFGVGYYWGKR